MADLSTTKSYTGLKAIIIAKLQAILGKDDEILFSSVYAVEKTSPSGYPCCFVFQKTGGGEVLDTHRNEREWQFDVVINQMVGNKTPEQADAAILDSIDRIISAFDEDPMLLDVHDQSQCKWLEVVPITFGFTDDTKTMSVADFVFAIKNVVNRYA